jgi:hypothetical protein
MIPNHRRQFFKVSSKKYRRGQKIFGRAERLQMNVCFNSTVKYVGKYFYKTFKLIKVS